MTERFKVLNRPSAGRMIFKLSLLVAGYFLALRLLYEFSFDHVLIGVVREMITLPMLGLGLVLLAACFILTFRRGLTFRSFHLYSLLILLAITCILFI